ncbi:MAG: family 16 glycoside hydrolase [bacterium]|nr:family 16 glycoside hydrolase [bacterium]
MVKNIFIFFLLIVIHFNLPLLILHQFPNYIEESSGKSRRLISQDDNQRSNLTGHSSAEKEIINPKNWIARGGCWDFSDKIFFSQGYRGGNKAYYKKQDYKNFTLEVKVMKLAEDGPLGIVFRYDDAKDNGYIFAVFPHGEYFISKLIGQTDEYLQLGETAYLNEEINTWNTLKVVAAGAKFDCYINGNFLSSVTDHSFSTGKIGLWNSGDPRQLAKFEIISIVEH